MKPRRAYYLSFIATLVFGLIASTFLTTSMAAPGSSVARNFSPATGPVGTLTGCLGATSSSTGLTLGGRVITPSTILRVSPEGVCGGNEANLNIFSYANTVLVSAGRDNLANGTNLLATLTTVAALGPSLSKSFLLKLEPGIYDLGSTPLQLVPYVHVEGSGEGATRIIGSGQISNTTGIILAAANTQLRELTVESRSGNNYSTGIYTDNTITSNFSISRVTVLVAGGSTNGTGINNNGGSPVIENATIIVSNTTTNGLGYGISNVSNAARVQNSFIQVQSTGTGTVTGIYNSNGAATLIKNNLIDVSTTGVPVSNLSPDAIGIGTNFASPLIQDTNITATTTGGGGSIGVVLNNSNTVTVTTTIENSDIVVNSSGASFIQGILNNTAGNNPVALVVRNSSITVTGANKTNCQAFGVDSFGAPTAVFNTSINVSVGAGCLAGVGLILQGAPNDLTFNNGYVKSTQYAIYNNNGTAKVKVGASQLAAPNLASGQVVCVNSFKSDYTTTTATCS